MYFGNTMNFQPTFIDQPMSATRSFNAFPLPKKRRKSFNAIAILTLNVSNSHKKSGKVKKVTKQGFFIKVHANNKVHYLTNPNNTPFLG